MTKMTFFILNSGEFLSTLLPFSQKHNYFPIEVNIEILNYIL
jgi:hypothetical protein